jgi:hypothetical protein
MATRLIVTLDPEQHRRAKQKAEAEGVSLAEYIRRLVVRDLGEERTPADVTSVFGLFDSGGSDVGTHKDAYVAQAVDARSSRRDAE